MPSRLKRYQQTGDLHFLTFSCCQRRPLLRTSDHRDLFERVLENARIRYGFFVCGYVIMPEHVHLLVSEPKDRPLSSALNGLKLSVSKQIGVGQFWEQRYYDFNVWTEKKRIEKLRYMHRNPVKRGLVQSPEQWRWSSFRHYATGEVGVVEIESHWTASRRTRTPP